MTDRELLEKAAKAAGYCCFISGYECQHNDYVVLDDGTELYWNPLLSCEDAFRLMCDLRLMVDTDIPDREHGMVDVTDIRGDCLSEVNVGDCIYTATRRAIVLAAVAMVDTGDDKDA
jgi:hypothetical protein